MSQIGNPTRVRLIEEIAERILAENGMEDKLPIPVDALAALLHLDVKRCKRFRFDRLQGAGWFDQGMIFTQGEHHFFKQRFTIAHEIAHYVMLTRLDPTTKAILYGGGRRRPKDRDRLTETLANLIAASMLMPRRLLEAAARKCGTLKGPSVRELASTFETSPMAMTIRLEYVTKNSLVAGLSIDWDSIHGLRADLKRLSIQKAEVPEQTNATQRPMSILKSVPVITPTRDGQNIGVLGTIVLELVNRGVNLPGIAEARQWVPESDTAVRTQLVERPLVVEFAGIPNAGKDTVLVHARDYLEKILGLKVQVFEDEYRALPHHLRKRTPDPRFLWGVGGLIRNLSEIALRPANSHILLVNKGLFDALAYMEFQQASGAWGKEDANHLSRFLLSARFRHLEGLIFWLDISPRASIEREERERRSAVRYLAKQLDNVEHIDDYPDTIENEGDLTLLQECYQKTRARFSHLLPHIDQVPAERSVEDILGPMLGRMRESMSPTPVRLVLGTNAESIIQMPLPGIRYDLGGGNHEPSRGS